MSADGPRRAHHRARGNANFTMTGKWRQDLARGAAATAIPAWRGRQP
jgi:hypothetical protein